MVQRISNFEAGNLIANSLGLFPTSLSWTALEKISQLTTLVTNNSPFLITNVVVKYEGKIAGSQGFPTGPMYIAHVLRGSGEGSNCATLQSPKTSNYTCAQDTGTEGWFLLEHPDAKFSLTITPTTGSPISITYIGPNTIVLHYNGSTSRTIPLTAVTNAWHHVAVRFSVDAGLISGFWFWFDGLPIFLTDSPTETETYFPLTSSISNTVIIQLTFKDTYLGAMAFPESDYRHFMTFEQGSIYSNRLQTRILSLAHDSPEALVIKEGRSNKYVTIDTESSVAGKGERWIFHKDVYLDKDTFLMGIYTDASEQEQTEPLIHMDASGNVNINAAEGKSISLLINGVPAAQIKASGSIYWMDLVGKQIKGLGDPTEAQDAMTKQAFDTSLKYVNRTGDSILGNLTFPETAGPNYPYGPKNICTPTADHDAATKLYVDGGISAAISGHIHNGGANGPKISHQNLDFILPDGVAGATHHLTATQLNNVNNNMVLKDGSVAMTNQLNCATFNPKGLSNPTYSDEASNKGYVDNCISSHVHASGQSTQVAHSALTGILPSGITTPNHVTPEELSLLQTTMLRADGKVGNTNDMAAMSANLNFNGFAPTGLPATPAGNSDAVSKSYVANTFQSLLPIGTILMYSGSGINSPDTRTEEIGARAGDTIQLAGWKVCNGQGTPDLKERFVIGAFPTGSLGITIGSSGGAQTHSHTLNNHDSITPSHNIGSSVYVDDGGSHTHGCSTQAAHYHTISDGSNSTGKYIGGGTDIVSKASHTHTIENAGGHSHTINSDSSSHNHAISTTTINTAITHNSISLSAHSMVAQSVILPKYYAVLFIIKVQ